MQRDIDQAERDPVATVIMDNGGLTAGLPANVVKVVALLDQLETQAAEIRRCAEAMRVNVSGVLAG